MSDNEPILHADWLAEAARLFGPDPLDWRFECPVCHYKATLREYKEAGADQATWAFSCVGRSRKDSRGAFDGKGEGPCNYAGGGLFRLNPVPLIMPDGHTAYAFAFAPFESENNGSVAEVTK